MNNTITQDGSVYSILYKIETYFADGSSEKRYVVENLTRLDKIKSDMQELFSEIEKTDNEALLLRNETAVLEEMTVSHRDVISLLEEQKAGYERLISGLEQKESGLEARITGNILMPAPQFRAVVIILAIIIGVFIILRMWKIRSKKK